MEKTCSQCGMTLPLDSFYRDRRASTGRDARCKVCQRKASQAWRLRNPDHALWTRESNPERNRLYKRTPLQRQRNKARAFTRQALRVGVLTRPPTCSSCGATGRIESHHEDYSKPLEVTWLCRPCHIQRHTDRPPIEKDPAMSNRGKTYKRRGGKPPRLTHALELAHRAAKQGGYRSSVDEYYVDATLAELARRRAAHKAEHELARTRAPEASVTTDTN